jgi:glycolate oxidase iron-sulfur subunit
LKLAYHDACHLAHAQQVTAQPRRLLQSIPNLTLVAIPEGDLCWARPVRTTSTSPRSPPRSVSARRRISLSTGADAVVTGNIGCLGQLRAHLAAAASSNGGTRSILPVWHTMEILDRAYGFPS